LTRAALWLLAAGAVLFAAVLLSQGLSAVFATLAMAGWGLLLVALFHLLPLVLDAAAIRVLFEPPAPRRSLLDAVLARWVGESANSLMPAGQIGGPVLMVRYLAQRGMPLQHAAAAITVSTTFQTLAQLVFAFVGVSLLGARSGSPAHHSLRVPVLIGSAVLALMIAFFYLLQRRGLFAKLTGAVARISSKRDWSQLMRRAEAIDLALRNTHSRAGRVAGSFLLSLVGWLVGAGEVYLILQLLGRPVSWSDALLLESLGQAVRGAAFAIPASLGVQEGGYVLLAPLVGLNPDVGLALSLAKRAREILLGLPGLLYLHRAERVWRQRVAFVGPDG